MAPLLIESVSPFNEPERRKVKVHKNHSSGSKLSKPAAIAIVVVVAVMLIAAIVVSIIMQRRRKARNKENHISIIEPYSKGDSSNGPYSMPPGYAHGSEGGRQPYAGTEQEKYSAGDYRETSFSGYHGGYGGDQGEAASYLANSQDAQGGGGVQGRDYSMEEHAMPPRPKMAYNPSPTHI